MIAQANKPWYVGRRGELLAEQFLLELEPRNLSSMQELDIGIDYMAFFQKPDGTTVVIAVEVKATEQKINGRYPFPAAQAKNLLNMHLPVLIVVADVKDSSIYFNWIQDAVSAEQRNLLDTMQSISISLRPATTEECLKLRGEILQQKQATGLK